MAKIPTEHIIDIGNLRQWDHIIITKKHWTRLSYQHHGIVTSVSSETGKFNMLHYNKPNFYSSCTLVSTPENFEEAKKEGIFVVQYDEGECLDDEKVQKRVEKCTYDKKKFDRLNRTSKEMALHCKVGSNPIKTRPKKPRGNVGNQREVNLAATSLPRIDPEITRKEIKSINELHPADHIFIKQWGEEHGIVMSVNKKQGHFDFLHYCEEKVIRHDVSFNDVLKNGPTRIEYEDFDCLDEDEVLRRAASCIDLGDFHSTKQTSEHIAYYCKIGRPIRSVPMSFEEVPDDGISLRHIMIPVTTVRQLIPGDHVVNFRNKEIFPYGQHGIIIEVFLEEEYSVIHYTEQAIIRKEINKFDELKDVGGLFLVQYDEGGCKSQQKVIAAAKECVEKEDQELFLRKIMEAGGKGKSEKVSRFLTKFKNVVKTAGKHAAPGIALSSADDIALALGKGGIKTSRALGAKVAFVGGGLEALFAASDISLYKKQRRERKIPEKKFLAKVLTRSTEAASAIGGGTLGAAIGAPLGPPGMALGSVLGSVGASLFSKKLYNSVERSGYLEEPIYDTSKSQEN